MFFNFFFQEEENQFYNFNQSNFSFCKSALKFVKNKSNRKVNFIELTTKPTNQILYHVNQRSSWTKPTATTADPNTVSYSYFWNSNIATRKGQMIISTHGDTRILSANEASRRRLSDILLPFDFMLANSEKKKSR